MKIFLTFFVTYVKHLWVKTLFRIKKKNKGTMRKYNFSTAQSHLTSFMMLNYNNTRFFDFTKLLSDFSSFVKVDSRSTTLFDVVGSQSILEKRLKTYRQWTRNPPSPPPCFHLLDTELHFIEKCTQTRLKRNREKILCLR